MAVGAGHALDTLDTWSAFNPKYRPSCLERRPMNPMPHSLAFYKTRLRHSIAAGAVLILAACTGTSTVMSPHTQELRDLFEQDQAIRANGFQGITSEELKVVLEADGKRKARVLELLALDALILPEDCYRAAMVLQHGDEPADFLMAHVLASAAAQDGHEAARWLSAASLDRYLMSVDQPQVFRTQFHSSGGGPWTQDPALDLLGGGLRASFGVPSLADSKRSLQEMNGK